MINIPNGHIILPESVDTIDSVLRAPLVKVEKGLARAVTSHDLLNQKFYGGIELPQEVKPGLGADYHEILAKMVSRDFDIAVRERLLWASDKGMVGLVHDPANKKFDDRKFRFDSHELDSDGSLSLRFGPSHFPEHTATNVKALNDPAFHGRLMDLGRDHFNDPMAYFANAVAVDVVTETADNLILVGKRAMGPSPLYPGFWHNIGGFAEPKFELFDLPDNGQAALNHFKNAMFSEMVLEAKIEKADVSKIDLIGVTYGISSVDLNYRAKVNADAKHIMTEGHYAAAEKGQHSGFVAVTFGNLVEVLAGKKTFDKDSPDGCVDLPKPIPNNIVPLGRGGMLVYVGLKDKDALKYILKQPPYQFSV